MSKDKDIDTSDLYSKKEWRDKILGGIDFSDNNLQSISTSSIKLDFALGKPFLEGSIVEIFGDNSVGKSTLALEVASNAMLAGKRVFYIDLERKLREAQIKMIKNFGRELFTIIYPDTGEETINMMYECINSFHGCVIILDSVSGLLPEVEEAEDASKQSMGLVARLCHKMIRKVTGPASRNRCLLVFLNHKTASMQMYGPSDTVHGGKAIVNRAAQRIEMTRNMSGLIKDGKDEVIGQMVRCRVIKNNVNRPFISCEIPIIYGKGIDSDLDLFQFALEIGVISGGGKGGWYEAQVEGYKDQKKHQSDILEMFQSEPKFRKLIVDAVTAIMES